ncbi:MAG: glycosyl hydrolase family 28-related protein [Puniceicoccales bacterium]
MKYLSARIWVGFALLALLVACQDKNSVDLKSDQNQQPWDSAPDGSWQSELYSEGWDPLPSRLFESEKLIQDFSYAGYANGERPIPSSGDTRKINVLDYGADPSGQEDSTSAIQQAINQAAAQNEMVTVYMPEGVYRISPPREKSSVLVIRKGNIVLQGAGVGKTKLLNTSYQMRGQSIIYVTAGSDASWRNEEVPATPIAKDLLSPTLNIPVEQSEGFEVGDSIIIRADPTPQWLEDHREPEWTGYEDKVGSILYQRRIKSIDRDNNILTINAPTRYALKRSYKARVYKKTGMLEEVGLQDFSIGNLEHPGKDGWGNLDFVAPNTDYGKRVVEAYQMSDDYANKPKSAADVHFSYAISMFGVNNGWIRNVDSYHPNENESSVELLSNGIRLKECANVTIANCVMRYPQYGGGGGNGYMFRIDNCNECLIENCTAAYARHGYSISGMASSGNVLLECQDIETGRQVAGTGTTWGKGSDHHMFFSHSNLLDNCVAENSWFEARDRYFDKMSKPKHNTTSAHTVFWNTEGRSGRDRPYVVWSMQGKYGYVIGTRGKVTDVRIDGDYPERTAVSDPVDHVEGIGMGETLYPQSLYRHQLASRTAQGTP